MRENKGFTLIELLAVIVILAIIALIATPVIMNIINSSRTSAADNSAKLMISELRLAWNEAYMNNQSTGAGTDPTALEVANKFDMDGATANGSTGNVVVTDSFNSTCTMSNGAVITCEGTKLTNNGNNIKSTESFNLSA